jgi:hypothetical protein
MCIVLTRKRISYREITYVYGKTHMIVIEMIIGLEITKLSYIGSVIFWSWPHVVWINGNKWADIMCNINYMEVFE